MRFSLVTVLVLGLVGSASADSVLTGRVVDLVGKPIVGARVHVLSGTEQKEVTTDKDGRYRIELEGDKDVSVVVGAGTLHTFRRGSIKPGTVKTLDFEVETADGEIIRIIDSKPPTVVPKLQTDRRIALPYSAEAVERDAWAKAWLILDVDETGKVARVKLLKRPGFDLDEIAVREALKLKFDPALDENGKPMRTQMLWGMEWPSHGWLVEHGGVATSVPVESFAIDPFMSGFGGLIQPAAPSPGPATLSHVPCAGSGPLNLDLRYPVYRDCSKPRLSRASSLPWLDGTQPIGVDPQSPYDQARAEPRIHHGRASYIPQIIASSVTAALVVTTVIAYRRYDTYADRLVQEATTGMPVADRDAYRANVVGRRNWQRLTLAASMGTILSGAVTALLWFRHQPRSSFSVQPDADEGGGSVTFQRLF